MPSIAVLHEETPLCVFLHYTTKRHFCRQCLESKGYIVRDPERSISSKDLYAVYCTWCDENAYPPMKRKTFVEYLSANEEKLGIHYTTHLTNSAGREVRGFRGIGSIISPPGYMQGGWQKVDPDDNPFKDA